MEVEVDEPDQPAGLDRLKSSSAGQVRVKPALTSLRLSLMPVGKDGIRLIERWRFKTGEKDAYSEAAAARPRDTLAELSNAVC